MPRGIDHIDLAVKDVDRSLAFYLGMPAQSASRWRLGLRPIGEPKRSSTSASGRTMSLVPSPRLDSASGKADGGEHRYFAVGIEHFAFTVDSRSEVDDAYQRRLDMDARIHCRRRRNRTSRATTPSSSSIPTGFGSR